MDKAPIIDNIKLMLQHLDICAIRAVYMVTKELYILHSDPAVRDNVNMERDNLQQDFAVVTEKF